MCDFRQPDVADVSPRSIAKTYRQDLSRFSLDFAR
jgi:hypothetical protein